MSHRSAALLLVLFWFFGHGPAAAQDADPQAACDSAAAAAERSRQLPSGILGAIGRVESGRADPAGALAPWPWTINAAGTGVYLSSADAAVAQVQALQQRGLRNIDVGCFQINLEQHPDAFASLRAAFDPQSNADYAADFLAALRDRTGSWDAAVAAYHSALAARGLPYRGLVFARWADMAAQADAAADPRQRGSVVIAGVRIWTPEAPGTAPREIHMGASASAPASAPASTPPSAEATNLTK